MDVKRCFPKPVERDDLERESDVGPMRHATCKPTRPSHAVLHAWRVAGRLRVLG